MSRRWGAACQACGHSPGEFFELPLRGFMGRRLCAYCFDLEVLLASPPEALRGYYRHCAAVDGFLPLEDETVIRDFAAVNKNDFARYITGDKEERI